MHTSENASAVTGLSSTPAVASLGRRSLIVGLALMGISFLVNAMDRQVFYPFLPEISEEFGFTLSQGGLLATGFTLGMAVAGIPAGYLVDKFSRKTVLIVSITIYSLGTIATPFATGFGSMAAYRLISGVGEGMQAAALYAALGAFFFLHRSFAFGALGVAFGVGVFIGPLLGNEIADASSSWRSPFIVFGCVGLIVAILIALFVSRGLTERIAGTGEVAAATYDHLPESAYNRNSVLLAICAGIGGLTFYGFIGLYPTYLKTQLDFSNGQAALATSMIGLGAAMSLFAGWFGDRFNPKTVLIITYAGIAVSAMFLFNGPDTPAWHYTFAFVTATFAAGSLHSNVNSMLQRSVRPAKVGRAGGLFISAYYAAAAISGFVMATLVGHFGWGTATVVQYTVFPLVGVGVLSFVNSSTIIRRV